jgi:hypothetical protein
MHFFLIPKTRVISKQCPFPAPIFSLPPHVCKCAEPVAPLMLPVQAFVQLLHYDTRDDPSTSSFQAHG